MKVRVTDAAWADILEIARAIQEDNPAGAERFVDRLYEHCLRLGDMPRQNVLVPGYEESGIRRSVFGNYLVFYRMIDMCIDVLHVVHGARDYERILFGEN